LKHERQLKLQSRESKAIYLNKATGETYQLGFDMDANANDTELSKAWDLVSMVARINGWNQYDIFVRTGK